MRGKDPEEVLNVYVRFKPNTRVKNWSDPLYLLKSLPEKDSLPQGTSKRHLFHQHKHKGEVLDQSVEELDGKLKDLTKTVKYLEDNYNSFNAVDRNWWDGFFEERKEFPTGLREPPDTLIAERTKKLLWGPDFTALEVEAVADDDMQDDNDAAEDAARLESLERLLVPRENPLSTSELGFKAKTASYVGVRMRNHRDIRGTNCDETDSDNDGDPRQNEEDNFNPEPIGDDFERRLITQYKSVARRRANGNEKDFLKSIKVFYLFFFINE